MFCASSNTPNNIYGISPIETEIQLLAESAKSEAGIAKAQVAVAKAAVILAKAEVSLASAKREAEERMEKVKHTSLETFSGKKGEETKHSDETQSDSNAFKFIKATEYANQRTLIDKILQLCSLNKDLTIEKNVSKIAKKLRAELDGNTIYTTYLAVKDDTIVGFSSGKIKAKGFVKKGYTVTNLVVDQNIPSKNNILISLFLRHMNTAVKAEASFILHPYKVNARKVCDRNLKCRERELLFSILSKNLKLGGGYMEPSDTPHISTALLFLDQFDYEDALVQYERL